MLTRLFGCLALLALASHAPADESYNTAGAGNFLSTVRKDSHGAVALELVSLGKRPVACFGLTKLPGENPRYSYLLIFKSPARPKGGAGTESSTSGSNAGGGRSHVKVDAVVTFEKKKLKISYRAKLNDEKKRLEGEELKLGGKVVKPGAPRIYLVDLTKDKVEFVPVEKVKELEVVPEAGRDGDWVKCVVATIEGLKKKSPEVKKFLE